MTRSVAIDVLQMANRVGTQCEAAEYEDLSEKKGFPGRGVILDEEALHQSFC